MKRKQKEPQRYMYKKGIYGVQLATTHRKAVQDSLLALFLEYSPSKVNSRCSIQADICLV